MPQIRNAIQLSPREMEVMDTLWGSETPLMASEIAVISGRSINTVNAVVKKLLVNKMVEVADIVYSGTVLSRRYRSCVDRQDYTVKLFVEQLKVVSKKTPISKIVARLIEGEDEERNIGELEEMIAQRKKEIQKEK